MSRRIPSCRQQQMTEHIHNLDTQIRENEHHLTYLSNIQARIC